MELPAQIIERIRRWVAETSKEGLHVDHEAARYGGLSLMGTIGTTWLLRPDGTLWEVDDDFGKPLQPLGKEFHTMALVAGVERHPWLAELLPSRPESAIDCLKCGGRGRLYAGNDSTRSPLCMDCSGLGWIKTR